MVNLIKHLDNFRFPECDDLYKLYHNGPQMRKKLALNHHWHDVLLDYTPRALKMDLEVSVFMYGFIQSGTPEARIQCLKEVNLSNLMHLKLQNIEYKGETYLTYESEGKPMIDQDWYYDGHRIILEVNEDNKERLDISFILPYDSFIMESQMTRN